MKKSLSLKDKMKSNAAIISVTIEDDTDFKQKLKDSEEAFPCTLTEKSLKLFNKPFVVAAKESTWSWDKNAWPLPGVPTIIYGLEGRFLLICADYEKLKTKGASALAAVDNFLLSKGEDKTFLMNMEVQALTVYPKTTVWLPCGWVSFVVSVEGDDEKLKDDKATYVAMVFLILDEKALQGITLPVALDIKQCIESVKSSVGSTATWTDIADAAVEWSSKLPELR